MSPFTALLGRFSFLLVLYQMVRLGFFVNNIHLFKDLPPDDIFWSFIMGFRFDMAAVCLINIPYCLLLLLSFVWQDAKFKTFLSFIFVLVNGIFLGMNIFDVEYFQFTGKRLTVSSFAITDDIQQQLAPIAAYYWYFSLIVIFGYLLLYLVDRRLTALSKYRHQRTQGLSLSLITLLILAMGARGGWQIKPIIPAHTYLDNLPQLASLSLNSSFTLLKSHDQVQLKAKGFYPNWQEVKTQISASPSLQSPAKPILKPATNVIIIIMESFNLEYMGLIHDYPGYTPFLDELASRGTFFPYHLANGRRSIDAMPSIFAGLPAWMQRPFITSNYQSSRLAPLPQRFADAGYHTAFFHGGKNGTMFFDVMAKLFGFRQYLGADDFPSQEGTYDGQWGIFDEPFLDFTAETLSSFKEPFFAGVFTLSSHHPYTIPEKYRDTFPKGTLEIHESIGYADHALRSFFDKAKQQQWYNNTLFVITADHTSKSEYPEYQTEIGGFRVPLILFHPNLHLPINTEQLSQHADVMPTLIDLTGIPSQGISHFGQSLLVEKNRHVITFQPGHFNLVNSEGLLSFDQEGRFLGKKILPWLPANKGDQQTIWEDLLRAKLQYFHNGLIENHLIW